MNRQADVSPPPTITEPETAVAQVADPARTADSPTPRGTSPTRPAETTPHARRPASPAVPGPSGLVVPVQGILPGQLSNTFQDARSGGRVHNALDIMAPKGTPVLAVADGRVEKLFDSEQGGLTLYQFDPAGNYAYYYAHLDSYAPGVAEGKSLRRGEVIGYVGSTGNATPEAPHLHFAVFLLGPEKQWWKGTAINPYPLLAGT
ncbi:MAG: peptidoglycan DD-metalloendopeptidase family protein [Pseudomonadota bacterium]|nr:peptidoglycan DD-metalloendopeptidase family protein [Pseudomonadota bacterium]